MTWEDYLDKCGLSAIVSFTFYDKAKGEDFTRMATLEAMGYHGGTLVVGYR
jgi:hypothetical protein